MKQFPGKKILLVSQSFYPNIGGVSSLLINMIRQLSKDGYQIYTLHFGASKEKSEDALSNYDNIDINIDVHSFASETILHFTKFKETLYKLFHGFEVPVCSLEELDGFPAFKEINEFFARTIENLITTFSIDILHIHDYQLMLACHENSIVIPKVLSLHFPYLKYLSFVDDFLKKYLASYDKIILSTNEYKVNAASSGIPDQKIVVLPPFIDEELIRSSNDTDSLIPDSILSRKKIILTVQRFDSKSGHIQLIYSFKRLLKKCPDSVLVLVGGDSFTDQISTVRQKYRVAIEHLVSELDIGQNVLFLGNVEYFKLSRLYSSANLFCLLSKMECFGMAVTEALSHGKPIVATGVGGLKPQVCDGMNGFLVDVDDIEGTASAFYKILSDTEVAERFSKESRRIFETLFFPEKIIKQNLAIYKSLCK